MVVVGSAVGMSASPARRRIPGWLRRWLLGVLLLLSLRRASPQVAARYGSGLWRRGRRLVGPPPLASRRVNNAVQCLALCGRADSCTALQFGDLSATDNCELFGQRACDGHELVADAAVSYYDVYDKSPKEEAVGGLLQHDCCVDEGYCSTSCADELCDKDTCESQPPSNACQCVSGQCQLTDNFWEVGSGLVLPKWMNWTVSPIVTTLKKLKPDTCALNISLKLGEGAVVFGAVATDVPGGSRLMFRIDGNTTDLFYHNETGEQHSLIQGADTTGMVQRGSFSPLRVSWCGGAMSVGPAGGSPLVTAPVSVSQKLLFVTALGLRDTCWLKVEADVADPWLFDGADTDQDVVFELPTPGIVVRSIAPTQDVSVTYDCMAERACGVWFWTSPLEAVYVLIGGRGGTSTKRKKQTALFEGRC